MWDYGKEMARLAEVPDDNFDVSALLGSDRASPIGQDTTASSVLGEITVRLGVVNTAKRQGFETYVGLIEENMRPGSHTLALPDTVLTRAVDAYGGMLRDDPEGVRDQLMQEVRGLSAALLSIGGAKVVILPVDTENTGARQGAPLQEAM